MTNLSNIKNSITFQLVCEEAEKNSINQKNIVYVIYRYNSLFSSNIKEKGIILCAYNCGNLIK